MHRVKTPVPAHRGTRAKPAAINFLKNCYGDRPGEIFISRQRPKHPRTNLARWRDFPPLTRSPANDAYLGPQRTTRIHVRGDFPPGRRLKLRTGTRFGPCPPLAAGPR